jgi:hypothetical protein
MKSDYPDPISLFLEFCTQSTVAVGLVQDFGEPTNELICFFHIGRAKNFLHNVKSRIEESKNIHCAKASE